MSLEIKRAIESYRQRFGTQPTPIDVSENAVLFVGDNGWAVYADAPSLSDEARATLADRKDERSMSDGSMVSWAGKDMALIRSVAKDVVRAISGLNGDHATGEEGMGPEVNVPESKVRRKRVVKDSASAELRQMSLFTFDETGIVYASNELGGTNEALHGNGGEHVSDDAGAQAGVDALDAAGGTGADAAEEGGGLPEPQGGDRGDDTSRVESPELGGAGRGPEQGGGDLDGAGDGRDAGPRVRGSLAQELRSQNGLTPLQRAEANVAAIEALLAVEGRGDDAEATPEERAAIAAYSGWVGAADAFKDPSALKGRWAEVSTKLKELLSDEEYADARASTLTACYTPPEITEAMFAVLGNLGFGEGENALEPGCGVGNFIGTVPEGASYRFTGIECESISSRMARILNPDANIVSARMEKCYVSEDSFDLAIGNVPFNNGIDIEGKSIHNWFIEKSIESLRPGGIGMFLTSRYTSDSTSARHRKEIEAMADLVGMVRLPTEAFEGQGAQGVVSDILVFRKRNENEVPFERGWAEEVDHEGEQPTNGYVKAHPECVIGRETERSGPYGPQYTVTSEGMTLQEIADRAQKSLIEQVDVIHVDVKSAMGEAKEAPVAAALPSQSPNFEYVAIDGLAFYGNDDYVEHVTVGKPTTREAHERRLVAMIGLRDATRRLLEIERDENSSDERIYEAIQGLNDLYDDFHKRYGEINSPTNQRLWATRPDSLGWSRLSHLEEELDGKLVKSEIFERRVIDPAPHAPTHTEDPKEAVALSLARYGRLVGGYIHELTGVPVAEIPEWSGGTIIEDPSDGSLKTEDDYLSGDLGSKLDSIASERKRIVDEKEAQETDEWRRSRGLAMVTPDKILMQEGGAEDNWTLSQLRDRESLESLIDSASSNYKDCKWAMDLLAQETARWDWRNDGLERDTIAAMLWLLDKTDGVELARIAKATPRGDVDPLTNICRHAFGREHTRGNYDFLHDPTHGNLTLIVLETIRASRVDDATKGMLYVSAVNIILAKSALGHDAESMKPINEAFGGDFYEKASWGDMIYFHAYNMDREDYAAIARRIATPAFSEWMHEASLGRIRPSEKGLADYEHERDAFIVEMPETVDEGRIAQLDTLAERLAERLPERVALEDVRPNLGAPWIPGRYYHAFMCETFSVYESDRHRIAVSRDMNGRWSVRSESSAMPDSALSQWGVRKKNPAQICMAAMNNSRIVIFEDEPKYDDEGNEKRVVDKEQTALANAIRKQLNDEFRAWCLADEGRKSELEELYNTRVNRKTRKVFDGSWLTLPGKNPEYTLRAHQKEAIARILTSDEGTIVAHAVGAGKTWTGAAACMEARRMGRATKPMIVVPNNLCPQWHREFIRLYPDAKVLCMTRDDSRNPRAVASFIARVQMGDWDAVIIPQSRFDRLKLSPELQAHMLWKRIQESLEAEELERELLGKRHPSVKAMEKHIDTLKARYEKLIERSGKTEGFPFEELGVDMLYVDEAHAYKNLAIPNTSQYGGLNIAASGRAENMLQIVRYLQDRGLGKNIVFATGTPVSNSMAELFNMEKYVAPKLMERSGMDNFTAWVNTFAEVTTEPEFRPEGGGYQMKEAVRKFQNIPELLAEVGNFMDVRDKDALGLKTPDEKIVNIHVPMSESQREEQQQILVRAKKVHDGDVKPEDDNMLAITTDGRKIALDPYLLHKDEEGFSPMRGEGKIWECCEIVRREWERTDAIRGTQLVLCDTSANTSSEWNVQAWVRQILIENGIPEDEIEIMSKPGSALTDAQKERIFEKTRNGEIRVLIGSTQTLGTGTNVQDHLVALHDLDCPWRPADLDQRKGRIVRQGNTNEDVTIYRYSTEETFDTFMWQSVVRKAGFVQQILSSQNPSREYADRDSNTLSYEEMLAASTGNQHIVDYFGLRQERQSLEMQREAYEKNREARKRKLDFFMSETMPRFEKERKIATENHELLESAERRINEATEHDNKLLNEKIKARKVMGVRDYVSGTHLEEGERQWRCTIGETEFTSMEDANKAIHEGLYKIDLGKAEVIGSYMGLGLALERRRDRTTGEEIVYAGIALPDGNCCFSEYPVNRRDRGATSALGQVGKVVSKFADREKIVRRYEDMASRRDDLYAAANDPWPGESAYAENAEKMKELCDKDPQIAEMWAMECGEGEPKKEDDETVEDKTKIIEPDFGQKRKARIA